MKTVKKSKANPVEEHDSPLTAPAQWHAPLRRKRRHCISIVSDGILRAKDTSLQYESQTGQRMDIPPCETGILNIYSNVTLEGGVLLRALENGTTIHVFSADDRLLGRFLPNCSLREPAVTHEQLLVYYNQKARLALAKQFLLASFHNERLVIRYYHRQSPDAVYEAALNQIDRVYRQIKAANSYENLLTLEAAGRKAYYECFDAFICTSPFSFEKRSRRPPENEMNAMLNFGNTLLYHFVAAEIQKTALDVRVGFLHATNKRMESLNLDLAEIFKPLVVDRCVLALINRKAVNQEMFHREKHGVYLTPEGKRVMIAAMNDKLDTVITQRGASLSYRQLIQEEVRKLIRLFRKKEKYKPFKQVR